MMVAQEGKFQWMRDEIEAMIEASDAARDENLSTENAAILGWQRGYIHCVIQYEQLKADN